tara:strand:- start:576 stop:1436 length:861 start_codon:yes stop_codon:yes gene_type:complete
VISEFKKMIIKGFEMNELTYNDQIGSILELYSEFLISENKKYNLTRITSPQDIIDKHFIDSILGYEKLKNSNFSTEQLVIMDVGTGAGFPGIPLILYDWICNNKISIRKMHLLDSNKKKTDFLHSLVNIISSDIDRDAIMIHNDRLENLRFGPKGIKKFNVNVEEIPTLFLSRATGDPEKVIKYVNQFIGLNESEEVCLLYYGALSTILKIKRDKKAIEDNKVSDNHLKKLKGLKVPVRQFQPKGIGGITTTVKGEILDAYRFSEKNYTRISVLYSIKNAPGVIFD